MPRKHTNQLHLPADTERSDLFSAILEIAHDAIIAIDQEQYIVLFNQGAKRIFGYDAIEVVGKPLDILLPPATVEIHRAHVRGFAESGAMSRTIGERREVYGKRKDGTIFPAEANIVRADVGGQTLYTVTLRDITERKRSESNLRDLISNLENAEQQAGLGSWSFNVQIGEGWWSKQMYKLLRHDPAKGFPNNEDYFQLIHPEDRELLADALAKMSQGLLPEKKEFRTNPERGEMRILSPEYHVERNEAGDVIKFSGTTLDVTERKRAENTAQEALQNLARITSVSPSIVYSLSVDDFSATRVTANIAVVLGYTPEEALAPNWWIDHVHPEDLAAALEHNRALFDTNADTHDYRFLKKDGGIIWVLDSLYLQRDEQGNPVEIVGAWIDITERKQAEEQVLLQKVRAESLARAAARLNAEFDLPIVLTSVCEETALALQVPAVAIALLDEKSELLRVVADYGLPNIYRQETHPIPLADYAAMDLQSRGEVVVVEDVQAMPGMPEAELLRRVDIRTVAGVSMRRGQQLIGWLNILTMGQTRRFADDELALLRALADQAAQAIANAKLYADAQRRLVRLQSIHAIDEAIANSFDLKMVAKIIVEKTAMELGVDAVGLLLLDPEALMLEPIASRGFRTEAVKSGHVRMGKGFSGQVALQQKPVYISDLNVRLDEFTRAFLLAGEDFVSYSGEPLLAKGQIKGVLEIFHRAPLSPDEEWFEFFNTLAGQAAIAIDSAQAFSGLQRANINLALAYDATIEGWSRAMDLRDKETEGHTQRVTELTVRLARALDMSEAEIVHVRRGALLHDMGKLGVPDAILLKPGKLTPDEWVIMRQHPRFAYDMLSSIEYLRPALDIPYCHHEKWDGTGYPRGLKGEQIPLAARIFAVADVWDALRSDRPYRAAWPEEKVLDNIRSLSGTHFDPKAVDVFCKLMYGNQETKR